LDYLFYDEKADTLGVNAEAQKKCRDDVELECKNNTAIIELAEQNAVNTLKALISPIIEQLDEEYTLNID